MSDKHHAEQRLSALRETETELREAKAEIELLRKRADDADANVEHMIDEAREYEAEVKDLRAALQIAERGRASGYQCARDNAIEIERLRAALREIDTTTQLAFDNENNDDPVSLLRIQSVVRAALSGKGET